MQLHIQAHSTDLGQTETHTHTQTELAAAAVTVIAPKFYGASNWRRTEQY